MSELLRQQLASLPMPNVSHNPAPPHAPQDFTSLTAWRMADDCRAKCHACRGRAVRNCPVCDGTGWVCPTCRGMQWLRTGRIEGGTYVIERCETCFTATPRMGAIARYMTRWQLDGHEMMMGEENANV